MHLTYIMAVILISFAGLCVSSIAGVDPFFTERSLEELTLMTEPELAGEARHVCIHILSFRRLVTMHRQSGVSYQAPEYSAMGLSDRQYLERIGRVVRDRHHGQMPAWFDHTEQALQGEDDLACDKAATTSGWHE